jgi:hypothetical protein
LIHPDSLTRQVLYTPSAKASPPVTDVLTNRDELRAWTLLARTYGLRYEHVAAALQRVPSALELIRSSLADLERLGFPDAARQGLSSPDWAHTETDMDWLDAPNHHLIPLNSPLYPALLANTAGAPIATPLRAVAIRRGSSRNSWPAVD